jgi:uncharacterized membrane protein YtjA (UPF0391 family)
VRAEASTGLLQASHGWLAWRLLLHTRQRTSANAFVAPPGHQPRTIEETAMLYYAVVFLVIALVAGFFGFFGVAGLAATIAKILFVVFVILFIASLIFGRRRQL